MLEKYKSFEHLNDEQMQLLLQCMAVCKSCSKMCIEAGHKDTAISCSECADICDLALKYKCCDSQFSADVLELCSKICEKCAEACKKMQVNHCKECADVCQKCCDCCSSHPSKK